MVSRNLSNVNGESTSPIDEQTAAVAAQLIDHGGVLSEYGHLLLAADAAQQREFRYRREGRSAEEIEAAVEDRRDAETDIHQFKDRQARVLLHMIRWAAEIYPGYLQSHLDPVFRHELDVTQNALVEIEDRVEKIEDAVVDLEGATT